MRQLEHWWPDVEEQRHSEEGGHHAVVDNGHFGVAALHLLGEHPKAEAWVQAVIDRFRAAILPHGCGLAGEPVDGPSFWPWENLWLLQFADALRNVTGIDLGREVPARLRRPLTWFRAHWAAPRKIPDQLYYPANANVLGTQLNACSPALLRLAQEAGDEMLRDAALADPRLGRIYRFGGGVKGSTCGVHDLLRALRLLLFTIPTSRAAKQRRPAPLSRRFAVRGGRSAVMRSSHGPDAAILCVSGYDGDVAHGFMNLHVQWAGHPVLRAISAAEAQPVSCGSLPCVGGQNEIVAVPGGLESTQDWQRLRVSARRTEQEYWLLTGEHPVVLVALRRRPRGLQLVDGIVRLSGGDALAVTRPGLGSVPMEDVCACVSDCGDMRTVLGCCSIRGMASVGSVGRGSIPLPSSSKRTVGCALACRVRTATKLPCMHRVEWTLEFGMRLRLGGVDSTGVRVGRGWRLLSMARRSVSTIRPLSARWGATLRDSPRGRNRAPSTYGLTPLSPLVVPCRCPASLRTAI